MFNVPPPESTYTRAQLCALAGISEGVASFWIRNGILRPAAGGSGKGSHRLFDRIEVSNAAILAALQAYGINVGMLMSLSSMMHEARDICDGTGLAIGEIDAAVRIRTFLDKFRRNEDVEIIRIIDDPSAPSGSRGEFFRAENEEEVIKHSLFGDKVADLGAVVSAADRLPAVDSDFLRLYLDVYNEIVADSSDPSWMLWPVNDGWGYAVSPDGMNGFPDFPAEEVTSAMYLAVGAIVRNVWKNSRSEKRVHYWSRRLEDELGGRFEETVRQRLADAIEQDQRG